MPASGHSHFTQSNCIKSWWEKKWNKCVQVEANAAGDKTPPTSTEDAGLYQSHPTTASRLRSSRQQLRPLSLCPFPSSSPSAIARCVLQRYKSPWIPFYSVPHSVWLFWRDSFKLQMMWSCRRLLLQVTQQISQNAGTIKLTIIGSCMAEI